MIGGSLNTEEVLTGLNWEQTCIMVAVDDVKSPINVHTALPGPLKSHGQGDTHWFAAAAVATVKNLWDHCWLSTSICAYFGMVLDQGNLQAKSPGSGLLLADLKRWVSQILFNRHKDLCVFNLKSDYLGFRQQGWISLKMVWDAKNDALWLVPIIIALEIHRVWLAERYV